jgi:3-isopropylmalate/(R)-2-methylmalate dehydratase small subunit
MTEPARLRRRGRVWAFGDDVLTDGQIMDIEMTRQVVYDPARLAPLAMCGLSADFARLARPGDFVVAGRNFGKGPMHIQGAIALAALDVSVLCESMARSFFRLGVSVGLRALPFASGITAFAAEGDDVEVDFATGAAVNHTQRRQQDFTPMAVAVLDIVAAGGEQAWLKSRAGTRVAHEGTA